ncbi:type I restriction-modification enzyme R subunit [Escherichia coli]|uniref:Type I restriction-modification enzyme R subunit n=1 Tax=Escherichia coli TaxID=562 RepID=A0A2X1Q0P6_ECOLX|nr:type I restriction-modification enzyme R subunit [Escherichia coli]
MPRKPITRRFKRLQEEAANKSATYKPLRVATISPLPPMKNKMPLVKFPMKLLIPAQWTAVLKSFLTLQFVSITAILKTNFSTDQ